MACKWRHDKRKVRVWAQLRRGVRVSPPPKGCPEGARGESHPTAEEF